MILYGATIWYRPYAKLNAKVPQLQRQALINIIKCHSTVSYNALTILAGCLPIHLVLEKRT